MKTVAITGGAGFVGSNLARELVKSGHSVRIIDDFSTGSRSNLEGLGCTTYELSITDEGRLEPALEGCDYIFHLAARGSVPRSIKNPKATFDVNTRGTFNVIECAREINAHLAFSSSSSVYGSNQELPKSELMWTAPLTPYAASKLSGEAMVQGYAASFGLKAITYRFFNIFGPWQRPDHDYAAVIPKWIWKLMNAEKIEVFGDGDHIRDFTYVNTVVSVLIDGMERELEHPSPLNLAFGTQVSLNEIISLLRSEFPALKATYLPDRPGDIRRSQNDPALLRKYFPNVVSTPFEEDLQETISWLREEGWRIANGPKVSD
jgi:UDP-glucose 4-epimerase